MSDLHWMSVAVECSRLSPPAPDHYAVGAVIVGADGRVLATGYTGETDPHYHAEEAALAKVVDVDLTGATVYSSLEPCTTRRSRPRSCAGLIVEAGLRRVVFALREPPIFADGRGIEQLLAAGVEVVELSAYGPLVAEINEHVLGRTSVPS
ncbi:MAG TPA: deaminase [Actinoplanes sp.]|jgi:diaminohydroxyphosphoribosylaminopyrimidine deaminase/5-amino-6-(5-phosphoribosylamino)uracil reductase